MPGYKNYTIKKYEKGGLVETKSYKDGKLVIAMAPVTKDSALNISPKEFVDRYGEDEAQAIIDSIKESTKSPNLTPEPLTRELENRAKDAKPK